MAVQSPSRMGGTPVRPSATKGLAISISQRSMDINQYEMRLPDIGRINVPNPGLGPHVRWHVSDPCPSLVSSPLPPAAGFFSRLGRTQTSARSDGFQNTSPQHHRRTGLQPATVLHEHCDPGRYPHGSGETALPSPLGPLRLFMGHGVAFRR